MCVCLCWGHEGFDVYGGSCVCGGVKNRFVFYVCLASWGMELVVIAAFPFFGWGMSGILDAQKTIHLCWSLLGVWVGFSMGDGDGGWLLLLGFRAIDGQLGGVRGRIRNGNAGNE